MQAIQQKSALLRAPRLPARCQRLVSARAVQVETTEAPAAAPPASPEAGAEIYIGFAKGDTAPRAGRKGRVIRDDPSKYPAKEDLGFLSGATGGWAGGEAGLWKLREEVLAQKQQKAAPVAAAAAKPAAAAPAAEGGKAPIYVGYGKYDTEARKAGVPGRFILDDPTKYPAKEDLGFLKGATGGFAAGEKGLKQFVRDGELQLRKEGEPGGNQASPVAAAFLLVLAGAGGGLLVNALADVATATVKEEIANAPVDDSTKTLLLVGSGLAAAAALLLAGRAAASLLQERVSTNADRLVLIGGACVAVFVGARAILEL